MMFQLPPTCPALTQTRENKDPGAVRLPAPIEGPTWSHLEENTKFQQISEESQQLQSSEGENQRIGLSDWDVRTMMFRMLIFRWERKWRPPWWCSTMRSPSKWKNLSLAERAGRSCQRTRPWTWRSTEIFWMMFWRESGEEKYTEPTWPDPVLSQDYGVQRWGRPRENNNRCR